MSQISEHTEFPEVSEEELLALFTRAADSVKGIVGSFSEDVLLQLYGLYKQSLDGPCITPKPAFWDFKGCKKWNAWRSLNNMSKEESMLKYVSLVRDINPEFEVTKPKSWITVSSMQQSEPSLTESEKTVFDFCREGDLEKLKVILEVSKLNTPDSEGMCLIHWAADRGATEILSYLVENGADLNVQDSEGQTPLHYAIFCENLDCVKILLSHGADSTLQDHEGHGPLDVASEGVKNFIANLGSAS